ncbi:MAG: hypothetical protein ACYDHY_06540 [Acidiferrobacterales bacterium]
MSREDEFFRELAGLRRLCWVIRYRETGLYMRSAYRPPGSIDTARIFTTKSSVMGVANRYNSQEQVVEVLTMALRPVV